MSFRRSGGALLVALSLCAARCSDPPRSDPNPIAITAMPGLRGDTAVLVGAGDIAACEWGGDDSTARILDTIPGTVITLGDNVYPRGTAARMRDCYGPSWGRHRARTRPSIGNHDVGNPTASAYFEYFGPRAGRPGRGYYAYHAGQWLVLVLDTEITGDDTLVQQRWLADTLAADTSRCQLAYGHQPRFTSGIHGDAPELAGVWRILQAHGVELALGGHDHDYERFVPMTAAGVPDSMGGIRSFVVGTGGAPLRGMAWMHPGSAVRDTTAHGVIELTLAPDAYRWRFIRASDGRVTDAGEGRCHAPGTAGR